MNILGISAFYQVSGTGTLEQTLLSVGRLLFRHETGSPKPSMSGGTAVVGELGLDNVTAIPEPRTTLLLALGLTALAMGRRRRAQRV